MAKSNQAPSGAQVIPTGQLEKLTISQIKPSKNNPRQLFDPGPLGELKESIRRHGVLVPITVYKIKGQEDKYGILDGERRFKCCVDLYNENGKEILIPANIVSPPNKIAGLLYMFSIHNFREQWELMPTAIALKSVMESLQEEDNEVLSNLTGLSEPQILRCKILLTFPEKFTDLSLDPDPETRIPSNFWIEALPVIELALQELPDIKTKLRREGIIDKLVDKYRAGSIKSVIHFRRIMEAYTVITERRGEIIDTLRTYILERDLETRSAFDKFIVENRRVEGVIAAADDFIKKLDRSKLEYVGDKERLVSALREVQKYIKRVLDLLEGDDPPSERRAKSKS